MILKPPYNIQAAENTFAVFLAGSIEMGEADNWQEKVEAAFSNRKDLCLLNPRRDDWDSSWKQEMANAQFDAQVNWELQGLERADLIAFYFVPGTKSPVSMLELGLFARSGKLIVCCPEGFWRKGNVDIVCRNFHVPQANDINGIIEYIRTKMITQKI